MLHTVVLSDLSERIAFQGTKPQFSKNLSDWLREMSAKGKWDYTASSPSERNVVGVEVTPEFVQILWDAIAEGNEPPDLYSAVFPPQKGTYSPRFISAKEAIEFDRERQIMAKTGRKVGVTPKHLHDMDGWLKKDLSKKSPE